MAKRRKLGLALGSGAIKGLFHLGVIKSLVKNNIPIDFIAGTSVGAIIGAHFALFQDLEKLEKFLLHDKLAKLWFLMDPNYGGGMIRGTKIKDYLRQVYAGKDFSQAKIPLRTVATDLISGKPIIFKQGKVYQGVYASMAVPGLFEPLKVKGQVLADGFINNPVPDDVVKNMGADVVLAINLDNYEDNQILQKNGYKVSQITWRTFEIMRHYLSQYSIKNADLIIDPKGLNLYEGVSDYLLGISGLELVAMGEQETEKIIPQLKKLLK